MQIYVGSGLKFEEETYYPIFPPMINQDPKEKPVREEPNPTEEFLRKQEEAQRAKDQVQDQD